jgi:hypothetical protein
MLENVPLFADLPDRESFLERAQRRTLTAGEVLFYEGDHPQELHLLLRGRCAQSWGSESRGEVSAGQIIDLLAALGGLPRTVKVTASEPCELLCWPLESLWQSESFSAGARRYLAERVRLAEIRRDELAAPIAYINQRAEVSPGPFRFDNVQIVYAFCDAPSDLGDSLPPGLSILQRPGRDATPLLVALAEFPNAYPEDHPQKKFTYRETTFFIPVRVQAAVGIYIHQIFPSAWEPILIGREVYGFPKQLGDTVFSPNAVALHLNESPVMELRWDGAEVSSEARFIRSLSDLLGIEGRLTAAAFQAGEVLRKVARLPAHRRLDVYNHRRIPAPDSTPEAPTYSVDDLTRATFGVMQWHYINRLENIQLEAFDARFADLSLHEAYRAKLDLRLSAGRVVEDYR